MAAHKTSATPAAAAFLLLLLLVMLSSTALAARQLGGSAVVHPFPDPPPLQKKGQASPPSGLTPAAPSPYIIQVPSGHPGGRYMDAPPPQTYWPLVPGD
ncbi:unnamed protein product [Urochloa decumbens]|uniref:Uncharacterized protein n=1 Tax=Urochloa decumbens TaxID=240449 RepID=A0ABC9GNY5_9POAL